MAERKIGSRWFKAGDALATDSIRLQVRLVKLIGPAADDLRVIFASLSEAATPEQIAAADAAGIKALVQMFADIDPEDVISLIEDILKLGMISYTGKGDFDPIEFDQEFSGANGKDLFPVLFFILMETIGDFFSGLLANGRQAIRARG